MKKLSKKQKLIGFIAIILIAVIIAIVITTSVIKNNNQIANEGYSVATANAGSNLVASYIKKGITIGGITGTLETLDTSDATATPCDIAKGKTAYVKGEKITGTYVGTVESTLGTVTGNETNNTTVNDIYGNKVVVPAGFKIVNPEDDVTKGIIIEDVSAPGKTANTKESQFVWIPVGEVVTDSCGNRTTIQLGRYTFAKDGKETLVQSAENYADETQLKTSSTSSYYYQELLKTTTSNNTKAKDIEAFVTKATTSGGYYIGRYEAGDAIATNSARRGTTNVSNPNNPITCKAGVYPYTYINQSDASKLCQEMYSSSNFESDLINSYAWDTAIVFIQEFSGDTNYSQQRGRNTARAVQKCGESILDYNLDTGDEAQDIRCNIYDMAGNTREWSTETFSLTTVPCVILGGRYNFTNYFTSNRSNTATTSSDVYISARPTLYL